MSCKDKLKENMIQTKQKKWNHTHEQNIDLALLTYIQFLYNENFFVKMKTGSVEYHNSGRMQRLLGVEEKIVLVIFFFFKQSFWNWLTAYKRPKR